MHGEERVRCLFCQITNKCRKWSLCHSSRWGHGEALSSEAAGWRQLLHCTASDVRNSF